MLEILDANPDEQFTFENDKETKILVSELGLTDRFNQNPSKGASHQSVLHFGNFSHFIQVILYLGNPDPKENGFVVRCFPRSKVTYSEFMEATKSLHDSRVDNPFNG